MVTLEYDEGRLTSELGRLTQPLRVAFAAACAERFMLAYEAFSKHTGRGDPVRLTAVMTRLWEDLEGQPMSSAQLSENIESCMELIPQEDDEPWVSAQPAAEDAAVALVYALRCRQTGETQEAVWAARRAYEAVDDFVINREGGAINEAEGERIVMSHPIVQAELYRQQRDLGELLSGTVTVNQLKTRARIEARHIFRVAELSAPDGSDMG